MSLSKTEMRNPASMRMDQMNSEDEAIGRLKSNEWNIKKAVTAGKKESELC